MEREDSKEPPIVLPPLTPSDLEEYSSRQTFPDLGEWLDRMVGGESYGAPRVFDLFTLLAITLAFALLLAFLRLIEPLLLESLDTVAIVIGLFVTGIGLFQMALWGGKKPRLSSLVAGLCLWLIIFLALVALTPNGARNLLNPFFVVAVGFSSVIGIAAGYLGGAMVAGVFLVADFFRTKYMRTSKQIMADNDDEIFADRSKTPPVE